MVSLNVRPPLGRCVWPHSELRVVKSWGTGLYISHTQAQLHHMTQPALFMNPPGLLYKLWRWMVYLMGLLFLVFCHPARQTPLTNDRLLPAEEFLIYVGNETRAKRFCFFFLHHANKVNDLHPATIKTGRSVYKRTRGEEVMSSRVMDAFFVILFLIL